LRASSDGESDVNKCGCAASTICGGEEEEEAERGLKTRIFLDLGGEAESDDNVEVLCLSQSPAMACSRQPRPK
jgi:hypothetical protein